MFKYEYTYVHMNRDSCRVMAIIHSAIPFILCTQHIHAVSLALPWTNSIAYR